LKQRECYIKRWQMTMFGIQTDTKCLVIIDLNFEESSK
jgi:hypothetical protein